MCELSCFSLLFLNFYLLLAVLGLWGCGGLCLAEGRGHSLVVARGLLMWWLLWLQSTGSRALELPQLWHKGSTVASLMR